MTSRRQNLMTLFMAATLFVAGENFAKVAAASSLKIPDYSEADSDLDVAPQVPLAATLTFLSSVEVDGDHLFLGKVATCSGSSQICDEAYGIDIGQSPEPGRSISWHPEKARAILAKEWPNADIRIAGAKVVKISASFLPLTEERVEGALKTVLASSFTEDEALTVALDRIMLMPGLKLRPGEYRIEFPELNSYHLDDPDWVIRNLSGNQRLTFHCYQQDGDGFVATFTLSAHFTVKALLPVAAHDLAKGSDITAQDLKSDYVPIGRSGKHYVSQDAHLIGKRLKHPLAAGAPLMESDVEYPRLLKRGQMVTLMVNEGDIAVSGPVKVLADGIPGQIIEAQYPSTKKKMRVQVIDANTVKHVF